MAGILEASDAHGPEQITAGSRVLGVVPMTSTFYRIGSTLVDAGPPNRAPDLLAHLDPGTIDTVLLTHAHEDHVGLAAALAERGARVLAPEASLPALRRERSLPRYRRSAWGEPTPVEAEELGDKVTTPDGTFEVVKTPGHSPDHVALFEPERGWLFTGDAYLGRRLELRFDEQLDTELRSLQRLRELEASTLFPGHGTVREDPDASLTRTIEHFEQIRQQAWRLREEGHHVPTVRRKVLGREGFIRYYTRGEFSKDNLIRQALSSPPDPARNDGEP